MVKRLKMKIRLVTYLQVILLYKSTKEQKHQRLILDQV